MCLPCILYEKGILNKLEASRALRELIIDGSENKEHLKVLKQKIKDSEDETSSKS